MSGKRRAVFLDRDGVINRALVRDGKPCPPPTLEEFEVLPGYELREPSSTRYKPKPGMLLEAARERDIGLARSYLVGDRWRDVGAGKRAGSFTIFIDRDYAEPLTETPDATCADLPQAAAIIRRHARLQPAESRV